MARIEIEKVENGFVVVDKINYSEKVYVAKTNKETTKIVDEILNKKEE